MGVFGLQSFIEVKCDMDPKIVSLIEKSWIYRKKYGTAVLAIDGLNVIEDAYCNPEPWIYGGQWKHYVKTIRNFVEKFNLFGIKPVFFFDGARTTKANKEQKAKKYQRALDKVRTVFRDLEKGIIPDSTLFTIPPGMPIFTKFILKYECDCDVVTCLDDADRVIAKFAKETDGCFGILSNDTDYLIFDTKPLYLARKLNINTMTTEVWHRARFAEMVGLDTSYLPFLSCMVGNSVISHETLDVFHEILALRFQTQMYCLQNIANVVTYLQSCKKESLRPQKLADLLKIPETLVEESLHSYNLTEKLNDDKSELCSAKVLALVRERCSTCKAPTKVYKLLRHKKYKSGVELQDPRTMPAALIYRNVRRRMYTILFGTEGTEVRERCIYQKSNLMDRDTVTAVAINIEGKIPSLEHLWSDDMKPEIRWKLFVSCFGIHIPIFELQNMKPTYVTMCCILNYLLHYKQMELRKYEIKAFICQAIYPCSDNLLYLSNLKVDEICPRAVSLVGIFMGGVHNLIAVLDVCGLPYPMEEAMPWKYFDGKLFHHCYNLLKEGILPEGVRRLVEKKKLYEELYRITTLGSNLLSQ